MKLKVVQANLLLMVALQASPAAKKVAEKIQRRAEEINAKLLAEERELNAIVQQVALSETKKEENNNDRKEDKKETSGNQKKRNQ